MTAPHGGAASRKTWASRAVLALAVPWFVVSCHKGGPSGPGPAPSASAAPPGLSTDLSKRVLARVGDSTITLGDYATVLDRMDRLERLRYQTPDRRKQLLDEMINVQLLAREAERRGLGDTPETKELVRQILREDLLRQVRNGLPAAADLPAADVRAYYDAHRGDFKEPERRRVAHILLANRPTADKVLAEARTATPTHWGELVRQYSLEKPAAEAPDELAGDLGLVTPPGSGPSDNARISEPVRAAAFEIDKPGQVLGSVVEDGGKFQIVRLVAKNDARDRSLAEADRTIRIRLLEDRLHKAEGDLERDLRARYPVQIDDAALAKVTVPKLVGAP